MPTRTELAALAHDLRNARTRLLPMEMAERVQHMTVRIEVLLASPVLDTNAVADISHQARQLLDECNALLPKP